jgi:hypothetical protein
MRKLMARSVTTLAGVFTLLASASAVAAPEGYELLFMNAPDAASLSADDQQAIYAQFNFNQGADGKTLAFADSECPPLLAGSGDIQVATEDLNSDGQPEVIVSLGSTCMYGGAGTGVSLFIKDAAGGWKFHDLGAGMYSVQETRNNGYADLMIGGPGFCHPVLRWDGTTYVFDRSVAEEPGGCDAQ